MHDPANIPRRPVHGFTLVELLVAAAIALAVMGALASLFGVFSRTATNSQAIVDLTARMRSTAGTLRQDLAGVTARLRPPLSPESDAGYFEIVEGPWTDAWDGTNSVEITGSSANSILADTDDALLFTTRSLGKPFTGRFGSMQIESPVAEVAWFCQPSAVQPVNGVTLQTLYRRQLLVAPYVGAAPFHTPGNPISNAISGTLPAAYTTYDMSLRAEPTLAANALVPNTLADLGLRENRFFHGPLRTSRFPSAPNGLTFDSGSGREGEDVVLTNVIAFDVRVFDPDSCPKLNGTTVVYPGERGYGALAANLAAPFRGAFIDLGSGTSPNRLVGATISGTSTLWGVAAAKSGLAVAPLTTGTAEIYDTWTTAYETNGIDDDGDGFVDEGVNGEDDDSDLIPDDPEEHETAPPYRTPLKAIEVRIRCFEPASREIRQITVRQTFSN